MVQAGIERQQEQVAVAQADVDPSRRLQAAQEEARAQQEQGADGHLRHDQTVAKAEPVDAAAAARVRFQDP